MDGNILLGKRYVKIVKLNFKNVKTIGNTIYEFYNIKTKEFPLIDARYKFTGDSINIIEDFYFKNGFYLIRFIDEEVYLFEE